MGSAPLIVLDTHCLLWYLKGDPRFGREARQRVEQERSTEGQGTAIAAITLWEISMLVSKGRVSVGQDLSTWFTKLLGGFLKVLPLEAPTAIDSVFLPGSFHGDPSDRMIIATARHYELPLITADRAILAYAREGYVNTVDASR